jgi:PTH1 family peptidyl-tRNA hydrolase
MVWLVVGLGNPGNQYALNRHNIGFLATEVLLKACGHPPSKTEFKSFVSKFMWEGEDVITLRPQTYMNRSGEAVQEIMHFYKIPLDNLIVIHDDIDQPFAGFKIHKNRGHGGHNGIRDISEKMASPDYIRIKLGVGRPPHPKMNVADYVLQNFTSEEMAALPPLLEKTVDAIETIITEGVQIASTRFNA